MKRKLRFKIELAPENVVNTVNFGGLDVFSIIPHPNHGNRFIIWYWEN